MYHDRQFDPPAGSYRLRCSERRRVALAGLLARHEGPDVAVAIRDLSSEGFAALCEDPIAVGTRFWLQLPGQADIPAEIKWRRGKYIGCEFEHGLSVRALLAILVNSA